MHTPKRILVVDDEAVVLGAVCKALRKDDFHVDTTRSASEALEILAASVYDVVITDLMMPGIDGLELLQHLSDTGSRAQTIMITGYPTIQTALRAKRLGAFEYVTKPFTRQELRSVVARAIRRATATTDGIKPGPPRNSDEITYYIPEHSWTRIGADGTARIGMAVSFACSVGTVATVRMPARNELLEQGRECAAIQGTDDIEHCLHCPLSGRVLELNQAVIQNAELAGRDPEGKGWLLCLEPQDPERESKNLLAG